jgi:serine/threonine-protein kinase
MASKENAGSLPGPQAFGRYYLRELINSGGTADIWFATNSKGEPFALRLLRDSSFFSFTAKRRFQHGSEVLSKIHNHENVIGYVEHGKLNGVLFLVMEYVEGANLKLLFARNDPVLAENVGNILIDMALGLEHVHDSGFMHLDFKPENVLVSHSAGVRLVDFDLAQPLPEKPQKMPENPGTPAYMAPEQLLRQPIDQRVDIFAYGVTAYELLTGRKPFPGETPDEILRKQLDRSADFAPPRHFNPEIPPALEKSILKCLERDPDKRYPIMSLLVHELQTTLYV